MKLYENLGVSSNSSPAEIKKAYRKLARDHHPDRGGDPEEWKAIIDAYEVLSDEARRKLYDETGDTALPMDPRKNFMLLAISECMLEVMKIQIEKGNDLTTIDMVHHILQFALARVESYKKDHAYQAKVKCQIERTLKRFNAPRDQEDYLTGAAKSHLDLVLHEEAMLARKIESHGDAIDYLKQCGYRFEKMLRSGRLAYGGLTASTTASDWGWVSSSD